MQGNVLIPPRIWVFMNTDWVHWFGARDAKTTISKTNLAHYGHVLSAHRPLPSDHYPSQSFQFPGCQIGCIVVQLCVAHLCVPNVTTGSMLCQIGCIVRGTPLHSTWCHLVVRKDVCTGHHIFRTLQKIHCSLMHTYVNSFSQCLVSSINLTSSVKICVWSRSSWKFRLANNRWSKNANVFSMPFNAKRRQCADKLGSADKLQTNFYDSKNERRQCADKLGFVCTLSAHPKFVCTLSAHCAVRAWNTSAPVLRLQACE